MVSYFFLPVLRRMWQKSSATSHRVNSVHEPSASSCGSHSAGPDKSYRSAASVQKVVCVVAPVFLAGLLKTVPSCQSFLAWLSAAASLQKEKMSSFQALRPRGGKAGALLRRICSRWLPFWIRATSRARAWCPSAAKRESPRLIRRADSAACHLQKTT